VTNISTWLPVVALALRAPGGRVLMQRRPAGKAHAGLWEFPGGKVEPDEIPQLSLVREITEELGLVINPAALTPVTFAEQAPDGPRLPIVILLYTASEWAGTPEALEGGEWGWFSLAEAASLPKPPLDVELLRRLIAIWRE
jgi:8-oxo-dGTP diphosphatase